MKSLILSLEAKELQPFVEDVTICIKIVALYDLEGASIKLNQLVILEYNVDVGIRLR